MHPSWAQSALGRRGRRGNRGRPEGLLAGFLRPSADRAARSRPWVSRGTGTALRGCSASAAECLRGRPRRGRECVPRRQFSPFAGPGRAAAIVQLHSESSIGRAGGHGGRGFPAGPQRRSRPKTSIAPKTPARTQRGGRAGPALWSRWSTSTGREKLRQRAGRRAVPAAAGSATGCPLGAVLPRRPPDAQDFVAAGPPARLCRPKRAVKGQP